MRNEAPPPIIPTTLSTRYGSRYCVHFRQLHLFGCPPNNLDSSQQLKCQRKLPPHQCAFTPSAQSVRFRLYGQRCGHQWSSPSLQDRHWRAAALLTTLKWRPFSTKHWPFLQISIVDVPCRLLHVRPIPPVSTLTTRPQSQRSREAEVRSPKLMHMSLCRGHSTVQQRVRVRIPGTG
jgi:hypothetical protein